MKEGHTRQVDRADSGNKNRRSGTLQQQADLKEKRRRAKEHEKAAQTLREQERDLQAKRRVAKKAESVAHREERRVTELKGALYDAQADLDGFKAELDSRTNGLKSEKDKANLAALQQRRYNCAAEVEHQEETAARERQMHIHAERHVQRSERLGVMQNEMASKVQAHDATHEEERAKWTSKKRSAEVKAAIQSTKRFESRLQQSQRAEAELAQTAEKQMAQMKAGRAMASQMLKGSFTNTELTQKYLRVKEQERLDKRIDSVLELKENSDLALNRLRKANIRAARRRATIADKRVREHKEILAQGDNPYRVFREQEVTAKRDALIKKQKKAISDKEDEVVQQALKDDKEQQKFEAIERTQKAYEKKYQNELGRHCVEERNRKYLVKNTHQGVELIDTTGHNSFQPSQVTTFKDHSFGLGKNPRKDHDSSLTDAVIDKIKNKPEHAAHDEHDLGEFARLVPKEKTVGPSSNGNRVKDGKSQAMVKDGAGGGEDDELSGFIDHDEGITPGVSASQTSTPGIAASQPSSALDGKGDLGNNTNALGRVKLPLSQFEREKRSEKQAAYRRHLVEGKPQVVSGITLKGHSLIAKPEVVTFADFDVGAEYSKTFIVTNVSLSFMSFKVMDISDRHRDFFTVKYHKQSREGMNWHDLPGRISAGMTCAIHVTFKPQLNEDISTEIPIHTETGPIFVPVLCTIKKVVPSMRIVKIDKQGRPHEYGVGDDTVVFDNVVIGEDQIVHVVIRNDGAIPTNYVFLSQEETDAREQEELKKQEEERSDALEDSDHLMEDDGKDDGGGSEKDGNAGGVSGGMPSSSSSNHDSSKLALSLEDDADQFSIAVKAGEKKLLSLAGAKAAKALQYKEGLSAIQYKTSGQVPAKSESVHKVRFAPLQKGESKASFQIKFTDTNTSLNLAFVGMALNYPIFMKDEVAFFESCVFHKIYRKKLLVCNRGPKSAGAVSFSVKVPKEFKGHLEYTPDMGFVQPGVDFEIGLKFTPTPALLTQCLPYVIPHIGVIAVPVQIFVPSQKIPIYFTLRAQLTSGELHLNKTELNFENCYITESKVKRLVLRNESALPQKFGFIQLPPEVDVKPGDGFGSLLPHEAQTVDIHFRPSIAGATKLKLEMKTTMGKIYKVLVRGKGVDPPLSLSHSVADMVPAAPGDRVYAAIVVFNPSASVTRSFEWTVPYPQVSQISVSPKVHTLKPKQRVRVEFEFSPKDAVTSPSAKDDKKKVTVAPVAQGERKDDVSPPSDAGSGKKERPKSGKKERPKSGKKSKGKEPAQAEKSVTVEEERVAQEAAAAAAARDAAAEADAAAAEANPVIPSHIGTVTYSTSSLPGGPNNPDSSSDEAWSRHANWRIPCYVRDEVTSDSQSSSQLAAAPMVFEVRTVTVERMLVAEPSVLDFGQLAVGRPKVMELRLRNNGDQELKGSLEMSENWPNMGLVALGLNTAGAFSFVNALRSIPPKGVQKVKVQFLPNSQGVRQTTITFLARNVGRRVQVALKGVGVSPVLSVSPPDGIVDCGHAVEDDEVTRTLTLHNSAGFQLHYSLKNRGPMHGNWNNQSVFTCVPSEGDIDAGQDLVVQVKFRPDHERPWLYRQELLVDVPNQVTEHIIYLKGRCHARQLYVVGEGEESLLQMPEHLEDPLVMPASLRSKSFSTYLDAFGVPPPDVAPILVRFSRDREEEAKTIKVGCIKMTTRGGGGGGSFELEWDNADSAGAAGGEQLTKRPNFFTADPERGTVPPGSEIAVTFRFNPPEVEDTQGLDVGQWTRKEVCVRLSGGFTQPHATEEPVRIRLEGYIQI